MVDRVEKIERIARVNRISNDNRQRYNSGRDRRGNSFAEELRRVLNKKSKPATEVSAAYNLELTSCGTQSLFYSSGLSLEALLR